MDCCLGRRHFIASIAPAYEETSGDSSSLGLAWQHRTRCRFACRGRDERADGKGETRISLWRHLSRDGCCSYGSLRSKRRNSVCPCSLRAFRVESCMSSSSTASTVILGQLDHFLVKPEKGLQRYGGID